MPSKIQETPEYLNFYTTLLFLQYPYATSHLQAQRLYLPIFRFGKRCPLKPVLLPIPSCEILAEITFKEIPKQLLWETTTSL